MRLTFLAAKSILGSQRSSEWWPRHGRRDGPAQLSTLPSAPGGSMLSHVPQRENVVDAVIVGVGAGCIKSTKAAIGAQRRLLAAAGSHRQHDPPNPPNTTLLLKVRGELLKERRRVCWVCRVGDVSQ